MTSADLLRLGTQSVCEGRLADRGPFVRRTGYVVDVTDRSRVARMSYAAGTETVRRPRGDEAQTPAAGTTAADASRGFVRRDAVPQAGPQRDPAAPAMAVFAGLAAGADLLVSAGAARAVAGGNADRTWTVFLVVFVLGAAAAIYLGDRLIKRTFPQR